MDTLIIFCAKYLFIVSPLVLLWLFLKKSEGQKRRLGLHTLSILGLSYALSLLARTLYYNPRPFIVEGFSPLLKHIPDNGFPSDHTLLLAALAASAALFDRRIAAALWIVALVVGTARVLAGIHHPIDILGSIVIVLIAKWAVYFALESRKKV